MESSNGDYESDDWLLNLFAEQVTWVVPMLPDQSRRGVFTWLVRHLTPEVTSKLRDKLPIQNAAQRQAEMALSTFLEQQERPTKRRRVLARSGRISRHTDWGRTLAGSVTRPPLSYWERRPQYVVDETLIRSLATLAWNWGTLLERFGLHDRAQNLLEARRQIRSDWRVPKSFGVRELQRLEQFDSQLARIIWRALRYWQQTLGEDDLDEFRNVLRTVAKISKQVHDNRDPVFEICVLTTIARSVIEASSRSDLVDGKRWKAEPIDRLTDQTPPLCLKAGPLTCTISKEKPGRHFRNVAQSEFDRSLSLLRQMGVGAQGYEPDLVLRFQHDDCGRQIVFALGDAKRNESGDGKGYIRASLKSTATAYLLSYAHLMGEPESATRPVEIETLMNPAVTLFFHQGIDRVAGLSTEVCDAAEIATEIRDATRLPSIIAFDRRHMGTSVDGQWDAPLLAAWFGRLAKLANEALLQNHGFFPGQDRTQQLGVS